MCCEYCVVAVAEDILFCGVLETISNIPKPSTTQVNTPSIVEENVCWALKLFRRRIYYSARAMVPRKFGDDSTDR